MTYYELVDTVAARKRVTPDFIQDSMTLEQIQLCNYFAQREQERSFLLYKAAVKIAIQESLGS